MGRKVFSILIFAVLFLLGIKIVFLSEHIDISYLENREMTTIQDVKESSFSDGSFQSALDNLLMDQWPERYTFVSLKKKTEYEFVNIFYKLLSNDMLLNPIGSGYVNQIGNSSVLTTSPLIYHEDWEQRISNRVTQINQLAKDYPDIQVGVYHPTQISEKDFFDEANGIESAGAYYESLFKELDVTYDQFDLNSFDEYTDYFYTTDHHWNHKGSYQGYRDIMTMFGFEDLILEPVDETYKNGLKFYGTYSSQTGFVTEGSPFGVYKFDLPEYTIENLDGEIEIENSNTFFDKEVLDEMDYHYNVAYRVGDGYTHIHSENTTGNSILIIGDSYAGPVLPLLTSVFDDIWLIYPTNYKALTGSDFNYDEFLENHDVSHLLIMYTIENYYLSDEWGDRYKDFDVIRKEGN